MRNSFTIMALFLVATFATPAFADGAPAKKTAGGKDGFVVTDKTFIDFTDTLIEGQMKAPEGFFLQGRQSQALRQMVRLRSKFRNELGNSKSAVMSLVK